MNRTDTAIRLRCPDCGAGEQVWCRYTLWENGQNHHQVGEPTKRIHNGRYNAVWMAEKEAKRAKETAMLREFFDRFGEIFV